MLLSLLFALAIPAHTGYLTIYDPAVLTTSQQTTINERLRDYETRTGIQFVILVIPTLAGETLEPFATNVFHTWGIGQKDRDNGVLLLWATKERKIRIDVGYGLESRLPDGRAGQIIRESIAPHFRDREWFNGVMSGIDSVIAQLDRTATPAAVAPVVQEIAPVAPTNGDSGIFWPLLIILIAGIAVAVSTGMIVMRRRKREAEEEARLARMRATIETPPRYQRTYERPIAPVYIAPIEESRPRRRSSSSSRSSSSPSSSSYSSGSSYDSGSSSSSSSYDSGSSSSSSSDFSGGGGDSGGGGASGDY